MWHGITHIAGLYPNRSAQQDFLLYGASLAKQMGWKTIKLELSITYRSIKYINQSFPGDPQTLKQLAQEPAFHQVFSDTGFERYVLTCFSLARGGNNEWAGKWNKEVGQIYEDEMYDFAVHLLTTYSNKEFIIANWEGDWQILNSFQPLQPVPRGRLYAYRDYQRRRQKAITRARAAVPGSTSTIKYAIELNRGLDGWGERLHRSVLKNVNPDLVSFSCYEAVEGWHSSPSQAAFEADIEYKLKRLTRLVREQVPNTPIFLGEYGWPIARPEFSSLGYDIGALWQKVIDVAEELGIIGEIPWQILDNEEITPGSGNPNGFYMFLRNGNSDTVGALSPSGVFYQSYLASL